MQLLIVVNVNLGVNDKLFPVCAFVSMFDGAKNGHDYEGMMELPILDRERTHTQTHARSQTMCLPEY